MNYMPAVAALLLSVTTLLGGSSTALKTNAEVAPQLLPRAIVQMIKPIGHHMKPFAISWFALLFSTLNWAGNNYNYPIEDSISATIIGTSK